MREGEIGADMMIAGNYVDEAMAGALSRGSGTEIDARSEIAEYKGPGNNTPKITFKEMLKIAESYPDKTGIDFR